MHVLCVPILCMKALPHARTQWCLIKRMRRRELDEYSSQHEAAISAAKEEAQQLLSVHTVHAMHVHACVWMPYVSSFCARARNLSLETLTRNLETLTRNLSLETLTELLNRQWISGE